MKVFSKTNKPLVLLEMEHAGELLVDQNRLKLGGSDLKHLKFGEDPLKRFFEFNFKYYIDGVNLKSEFSKILSNNHPFLNSLFINNNIDFFEYLIGDQKSVSLKIAKEYIDYTLLEEDLLKKINISGYFLQNSLYLNFKKNTIFYNPEKPLYNDKDYILEIITFSELNKCINNTIFEYLRDSNTTCLTVELNKSTDTFGTRFVLDLSFSDKEKLYQILTAEIYKMFLFKIDSLKKESKNYSTEEFLSRNIPLSLLTKLKFKNFIKKYPNFFEDNKDCLPTELFDKYLLIKEEIDKASQSNNLIKTLLLIKDQKAVDLELIKVNKLTLKGVDLSEDYVKAIFKTILVKNVDLNKILTLQKIFIKLNAVDKGFAESVSDQLSKKEIIKLTDIQFLNLILLASNIDHKFNSKHRFIDNDLIKTLFFKKNFEIDLSLDYFPKKLFDNNSKKPYQFGSIIQKLLSVASVGLIKIRFIYCFYQNRITYYNIKSFLEINIDDIANFTLPIHKGYFDQGAISIDYDKEEFVVLKQIFELNESLRQLPLSPRFTNTSYNDRTYKSFFEKIGINK